jgi:hypothetical protein
VAGAVGRGTGALGGALAVIGGHAAERALVDLALVRAGEGHAPVLEFVDYGQAVKNKTQFFIEYFALDLIMDEDGRCRGVMARWNCTNSMSCSGRPARSTMALPSPVQVWAEVAEK